VDAEERADNSEERNLIEGKNGVVRVQKEVAEPPPKKN